MNTPHPTNQAQLENAHRVPAVTSIRDMERMKREFGFGPSVVAQVKMDVQQLPVPAWEDLPSLDSIGKKPAEVVAEPVAEVAEVPVKRTRINTEDSEANGIVKAAQILCERGDDVIEFVERSEWEGVVTDRYVVKNNTVEDLFYDVCVRDGKSSCNCRAAKQGRFCWHRACILIEAAIQASTTVEVQVSAPLTAADFPVEEIGDCVTENAASTNESIPADRLNCFRCGGTGKQRGQWCKFCGGIGSTAVRANKSASGKAFIQT